MEKINDQSKNTTTATREIVTERNIKINRQKGEISIFVGTENPFWHKSF